MSGYAPVAVYTLQVPVGDEPTPALGLDEFPATFRITMAAIDPTEKPTGDGKTNGDVLPRATLKMICLPSLPEDSDDEDDEDEDSYDMAQLLDDVASDDDEDEDDEDGEEGAESRKATAAKLMKALAAGDDDMEVDAAAADQDADEDDIDSEDIFDSAKEIVLCTLDPSKIYQQTLDITINENEQVFFQVSGTHSVHLTGNILVPLDESDEDDEDDEYDSDDEYDLAPGEDELGMLDNDDDDDESDELDDLASPRVIDVTEDDVPAPKLVPADAVAQQQQPKGKNKRAAEDSPAAAEKTVNGGGDASKLTKAQKKAQKKLKNNAGAAVDTEQDTSMTESAKAASPAASKGDKKVQFASTLVQGPSSSTSPAASKADKPTGDAAPAAKGKASLGVKTVDGVTIDDKKLGAGPAAKKGDKVSMRYIGKLDADKRVFDSNKKGAPFTFKLGAGQVIKGWDIGVAGMSAGGERRVTIPAHLAYGSKSQKDIPANSTLVFDLKLLEIKK